MRAEKKAAWNLFLKLTPTKDWMDDEESVQVVQSLMKITSGEPVKRRKKKGKKETKGKKGNERKEQRTSHEERR